MNKIKYIDQMQRTVEINSTVSRIVSLVPSQTELLIDLGLADRLAGITRFCVHPPELRRTHPLVGGTKNVKIDLVRSLAPDLVIGNKEENSQPDIEVLEKLFPTWMSDIFNLEDALDMILKVGEITGTSARAQEIVSKIRSNFSALDPVPGKRESVLYLIWKKPYIAAGKNTFIDSMLTTLGFENAIQSGRYPEVDLERPDPDHVFLSSEPYPFREKHLQELREQFPSSRVSLVDGEFFSWYGSRLIHAPGYFKKLLKELEE